MKAKLTRGFTLIELLVVITIIAILASLSVPVFSSIQERGQITKGTNNARQIFMALKLYAADNDGSYPSGQTANEAFRELFSDQILDKEDVFGCPMSEVGNPDGNIGDSPDYQQAVERGENHWMMVRGLSDSSSGAFPILFENALDSSQNPSWDPTLAGTTARGRTWKGGKVIIATNDGAVTTYKTETTEGPSPLEKLGDSSKNIFQRVRVPGILDVEEGGGGGN